MTPQNSSLNLDSAVVAVVAVVVVVIFGTLSISLYIIEMFSLKILICHFLFE